jgi:hypothetical protein
VEHTGQCLLGSTTMFFADLNPAGWRDPSSPMSVCPTGPRCTPSSH